MAESRVLVVDADAERATALQGLLQFIDYAPLVRGDCSGLRDGEAEPQDWLAVIIGEVVDESALQQFIAWLQADPACPLIMVMAGTSLRPENLGCLRLELPLRYAQLNELLKRAGLMRMQAETSHLAAGMGPTGSSPAVLQLRRNIEQVAGFDTTVLICGESGSGKEIAARAIHAQSGRAAQRFVTLNCSAIPVELLEGELFGFELGDGAQRGRFELADGGTLFLDEIADLSLPMQARLLRVLQERRFERAGGGASQRCDVRVIAATQHDLEKAIAEGRFRQDLFYRLNVFPIETPPLRDRIEDVPALVEALLVQVERATRSRVRLSAETVQLLKVHAWPGNVRELSNLLERLSVLHPGLTVQPHDLPERYKRGRGAPAATPMRRVSDRLPRERFNPQLPSSGVDLKDHIEHIEASLIRQALAQSGGVVAHAARLLNTRRTTLVEKLRKYGMQREEAEVAASGRA